MGLWDLFFGKKKKPAPEPQQTEMLPPEIARLTLEARLLKNIDDNGKLIPGPVSYEVLNYTIDVLRTKGRAYVSGTDVKDIVLNVGERITIGKDTATITFDPETHPAARYISAVHGTLYFEIDDDHKLTWFYEDRSASGTYIETTAPDFLKHGCKKLEGKPVLNIRPVSINKRPYFAVKILVDLSQAS
jgi:hypothetical protein